MPPRRWRRFRLDLIDFAQVENLVMISGDTHYAELSRLTDGVPYPLYDLTSSGLTQVWEVFAPSKNRIVQAPLMQNYGRITIDWEGADPAVLLEVEMVDGTVPIRQCVALRELRQGRG